MSDGRFARERAATVRCLACALVAGLIVAGGDATALLVTARGSFLSGAEVQTTLLATVAASVALGAIACALGGLVLVLAKRRADTPLVVRRMTLGAFALGAVAADLGLWLLTSGRRAQSIPVRPLVVAVAAMLAGGLLALLVRAVVQTRESGARSRRLGLGIPLGALALSSTMVSASILPRSYLPFHVGLALLSVAAATSAADLFLPAATPPASRTARVLLFGGAALGLCLTGFSPVALLALRRTPNARYVTEERAPIVGRIVRQVRLATPVPVPRRAARASRLPHTPTAPGLVLASQDVLLVTIDALRSDRIAALGGHGLTPAIDALGREGVVFRHAYTATPHTSYALASILTGKLIRPVMELPDPPTEHVTLPDLLRRYGIRTAAFYPPAIFFVDEARFVAFHVRGFGFEYRKEMFAPAADRVGQLTEYLHACDSAHPVFAWVHLFEPHEPYDPPPGLAHGDTAEDRYDGEVRAADAALGGLVRVFRAARPGGTVIVTADHGEEFGDHGGEYHGTTLYDEQARVPLVWSTPGLVPPHVVDAPVSTIDLAPTLLAALGIPKDARMRGNDLGPVLRDPQAAGPEYAYASLGETWMITDGDHKEICAEAEAECRLFDLSRDPHERRNIAGTDVERAADMRRALSTMIGSIPRIEAVAMASGLGWPEPLARAELGDGAAGPDVVPLLASDRADVRAAAARALAKLAYAPAAAALARLRVNDTDEEARAEAAIAGLLLHDGGARHDVEQLVLAADTPEPVDAGAGARAQAAPERARRAALALAAVGDPAGLRVLVAVSMDHDGAETSRVEAIDALGRLRAREAVAPLVSLLADVRLRIPAAVALGAIGDSHAAPGLLAALATERYVPARGEEARALATLGERRAVPLIRRFLGMEHPVPDGVDALMRLGDLARSGASGAVLSRASALRRGEWTCDDTGCVPGPLAVLALPRPGRPAGASRIVLRVVADVGGGTIWFGDASTDTRVQPGASELAFAVDDPRLLDAVAITASHTRLAAFAWVRSQAELPPPPPQPWRDGGTD